LKEKTCFFKYLARKLLLKKYNWRRFGILYQYERQYTMVTGKKIIVESWLWFAVFSQ